MGACIGACNRKAESRARFGWVVAAGEAVEELRLEFSCHAGAAVFDRKPEVAVVHGSRNRDRLSTVAKRVREQVGHDVIERIGVSVHEEGRIDSNMDLLDTLACHLAHDLVGPRPNRKRLGQDTVVVLVTVFLFTGFLFIVDVIWIKVLSAPGIQVLPAIAGAVRRR